MYSGSSAEDRKLALLEEHFQKFNPLAKKVRPLDTTKRLSLVTSYEQANDNLVDDWHMVFSDFVEEAPSDVDDSILSPIDEQEQTIKESLNQVDWALKFDSQQYTYELAEKEKIANRLEHILTMMPVGVIVLNNRGVVQQSNPMAYDLLDGSDENPIEGEDWVTVIQRSFSPQIDDGHEVSTHSGRRISISTCSLGSEPGQLVLLNDLTETRELQEGLNRYKRLSDMGNMVASLAHQVRTPLSTAMLYAGMLKENQLDEDQHNKYSEKVLDRLHNIEQQIRDMLLFAKGDCPANEVITSRDLEEEIKQSTESLVETSDSLCVLINHAPQASLLCHKEALVGAIQNIIDNSVQAVERNADIRIELMKFCDGYLKIQVSDQGPGFDTNKIPFMLEPFKTTKPRGTGLGLAVVNNVVKSHGGSLSIETDIGRGVTVTILLPLVKHREDHDGCDNDSEATVAVLG